MKKFEMTGSPQHHSSIERLTWKKFLKTFLPWFRKKTMLADKLANAKMQQEIYSAEILRNESNISTKNSKLKDIQIAQETLKLVSLIDEYEAKKLNELKQKFTDKDKKYVEANLAEKLQRFEVINLGRILGVEEDAESNEEVND